MDMKTWVSFTLCIFADVKQKKKTRSFFNNLFELFSAFLLLILLHCIGNCWFIIQKTCVLECGCAFGKTIPNQF